MPTAGSKRAASPAPAPTPTSSRRLSTANPARASSEAQHSRGTAARPAEKKPTSLANRTSLLPPGQKRASSKIVAPSAPSKIPQSSVPSKIVPPGARAASRPPSSIGRPSSSLGRPSSALSSRIPTARSRPASTDPGPVLGDPSNTAFSGAHEDLHAELEHSSSLLSEKDAQLAVPETECELSAPDRMDTDEPVRANAEQIEQLSDELAQARAQLEERDQLHVQLKAQAQATQDALSADLAQMVAKVQEGEQTRAQFEAEAKNAQERLSADLHRSQTQVKEGEHMRSRLEAQLQGGQEHATALQKKADEYRIQAEASVTELRGELDELRASQFAKSQALEELTKQLDADRSNHEKLAATSAEQLASLQRENMEVMQLKSSLSELDALRKVREKLEQQIADLQAGADESEAQHTNEVIALRAQHAEELHAQHEVLTLTTRGKDELDEQLVALSSDIQQLNADLKDAQELQQQAQARLDQTTEEKGVLARQQTELATQLASVQHSLEQTQAMASQDKASLHAQLEASNAALATAESKAVAAHEERDALTHDLLAAQARVTEAVEAQSALSEEVSRAQASLKDTQTQMLSKDTELANAVAGNDDLVTARQDLSASRGEISSLRDLLEAQETVQKKLRQQLEEKEGNRQVLESKLATLADAHQAKGKELAEAQASLLSVTEELKTRSHEAQTNFALQREWEDKHKTALQEYQAQTEALELVRSELKSARHDFLADLENQKDAYGELEARNKACEAESKALGETHAAEIAAVHAELVETQSAAKATGAQLHALQEEHNELRIILGERDEQLKRLQSEHASALAQADERASTADQLQAAVTATQEETRAADERLANLERGHALMTEGLRADLEAARQEAQSSSNQLAGVKGDHALAVQQLQAELSAAQVETDASAEKVAALDGELVQLRETSAELRHTLDANTTQLASYEKQLAALRFSKGEVEDQLASVRTELTAASSARDALETDLRALRKTVSEGGNEAQLLRTELDSVRDERTALLGKIEKELQECQHQLKTVHAECEQAKAERTNTQEEQTQLLTERERLKVQLHEAQDGSNQAEVTRAKLKQEFELSLTAQADLQANLEETKRLLQQAGEEHALAIKEKEGQLTHLLQEAEEQTILFSHNKTALEAAQDKVREIVKELESIRGTQASEEEDRAQALRAAHDEIREKEQELDSFRELHEVEKQSHAQDLQAAESNANRLEDGIASAREELCAAMKSRTEAESLHAALSKVHPEREAELSSLRAQVERLQVEAKQAQERHAGVTSDSDTLALENTRLDLKLKEAQDKVVALTAEIGAASQTQDELNRLRDVLKEEQKGHQAAREAMRNLEHAFQELQERTGRSPLTQREAPQPNAKEDVVRIDTL